jgi:putative oxidoreductase
MRAAVLRHPYVAFVFRLALGAVFLWAGVSKAADPHLFGLEIARYRMVPQELINLMAILLPWIEIVAGLALVVGVWPRASALVCAGLMLMFIGALVSALKRGLDIECGCFGAGASASHISQATLWRDALWLFWALHVTLYDRGVLALGPFLRRIAAKSAGEAP